MSVFGRVECFTCKKSGKKNEFIYDEKLKQYFCCEEHRQKAYDMAALMQKARSKGLILCPQCMREIKPTAFACKYCGTILKEIKGYTLNKMCPFAVASVGEEGKYTWQHMHCIQEYCALWDFNADKCSFVTKNLETLS